MKCQTQNLLSYFQNNDQYNPLLEKKLGTTSFLKNILYLALD